MRLAGILLVAALFATSWNGTARAQSLKCPDQFNVLLCYVDTLSWVQTSIYTDVPALEAEKSRLESLIRLRARNDLGFLKHEVMSISDAYEQYRDRRGANMKRRAHIECVINTTGENLLALSVECIFEGFGIYDSVGSRFEAGQIGAVGAKRLIPAVNTMVTNAMQDLAIAIYDQRDRYVTNVDGVSE